VMALVIAPTLAPGRRVATPLNHYSLLATIEDAFHLSRLSSARSATNFATFFSSAPSSR